MMSSERPPRLSIVIPSFNGKHLLATCLTSIEWCAPRNVPIEVIVADDGSTDGTVAWLGESFPWVRVVSLEHNGGFCLAANAGLFAARAPVIQLLNNDTEVTSGWVEAGLAPFANQRIGSVAPLVLERDQPHRVDSAGDGYHVFGLPYKRGRGDRASQWNARPPHSVFGASASSAFYRASALKHLGGFNAEFGSYYEDVDLAFRLRRLGYGCVFNPACQILHQVSASYDHGDPELQRRMARNAELIFWRHTPRQLLPLAVCLHAPFLAAQFAHRIATRRARPFLAGKLDAARMLFQRTRPTLRPPNAPHMRTTPAHAQARAPK